MPCLVKSARVLMMVFSVNNLSWADKSFVNSFTSFENWSGIERLF